MAPHATSETASSGEKGAPSQDIPHGHRSLPQDYPCLSYWHRTTRGFPYLHSNHDQLVPASSKFVIIGSGLSGALTAFSLIDSGTPASNILILEAREAVSGASGRNAGHVRPDAFRGFSAYARVHGEVQAKKIIENEKLVFEKLDDFVKKHQVPCDFEATTTFDVCLTPEFAEYERESFEAYKAAGGDVSHVKCLEGEEARRRTRVKEAVAAYEWPAGSSHPAKLAQWLLSKVIEKGGRLWTHCPALTVAPHSKHNSNDNKRWDVETARGTVSAEHVIHCTNAYASHLLPQLATFITPNRAQAHSFVPSFSWSGSNALASTMSLRYSLHHFFSLIQRRGDGTVVFGVSRKNPGWSQATQDGIISFDDGSYSEEVAASAEQAFIKLFPEDHVKQQRHGEGADHYWSGIIAMTPDSVPLVGPVEGLEGQWICAGHNGHGMARIWTSAPGLVKLIRGESWESTGLPECFQSSRASQNNINRMKMKPVSAVW